MSGRSPAGCYGRGLGKTSPMKIYRAELTTLEKILLIVSAAAEREPYAGSDDVEGYTTAL